MKASLEHNSVKPGGTCPESLILIAHTIQDTDIRPGVQNKPAKREACDENERAMDLDAKQAELEEKTRFAASFKNTCFRSAEHCKLADAVPSDPRTSER